MSDFKTRLIAERDELVEKTNKLAEFLEAPKFLELGDEHQFLLIMQHAAMSQYALILNRRLFLLGE